MSSLRCTYSGGGDYHYFKGGEALNVHSLYVHGMSDIKQSNHSTNADIHKWDFFYNAEFYFFVIIFNFAKMKQNNWFTMHKPQIML